VQHWRSVKQQQAAILRRKHALLKEQVEVLQQQEDLQQQLVGASILRQACPCSAQAW
jgi:hypothetical protein